MVIFPLLELEKLYCDLFGYYEFYIYYTLFLKNNIQITKTGRNIWKE